jgi:hypothetical protein
LNKRLKEFTLNFKIKWKKSIKISKLINKSSNHKLITTRNSIKTWTTLKEKITTGEEATAST